MSFFYIGNDVSLGDSGCGDDVIVLLAGGELDFAASPQLGEHIAQRMETGSGRLVLDLSSATFIDSTAIGVLVRAATRLRESGGGSLAIICPEENREILQIFEVAGVSNAFALYRSREDALSTFGLAA